MNKKPIDLEVLRIPTQTNSLKKYFELIENLQKDVEQDTYLLMDNLYEENASCIDTYSLFLYLKKNNYKAKYVLYQKNPLYKKLKDENNLEDIIVCSESSLIGIDLYEKLFSTLIRTKYIILSYPDSLYLPIRKWAYRNKKVQIVGIGHGPVFFKTSILHLDKTDYLSPLNFNLYLVSSDKEKKLFIKHGWPESKLLNIGLPRFDLLKKEPHKEKNIFIMFTWRLTSFRYSKDVKKLKYFKALNSLLNNKELQTIANKNKGINIIIAMHHAIKDLCGIKIRIPSCFKIADSNNLLDYINTADLFITDYSSIVHDFMFLETPVIFYRLDDKYPLLLELDQIDARECKEKDEQVFNVFYDEEALVSKIKYYIENNFKLEQEYKKIENSFFTERKELCKKLTEALENHKEFENNEDNINPIWEKQKTAICVSSSNEYVPYLSVFLESIIEKCSRKKDIIIFERSISKENKEKINKFYNSKDTSIRFVNPSSEFEGIDLHVSHDYFKEECYYRITAPKILNKYEKIIFTDLDLIVKDDILKLSDIDIQNSPIAACIEPVWQELYLQDSTIQKQNVRDYTNNILKLNQPYNYYNTGVVVFNVKEYNRLNYFEKILDIIENNKLLYQEQCALNMIFKDDFYTLPAEWNYELAPSLIENKYSYDFYNKYKENEQNAKIIHYLGRYKPWKNSFEYRANEWWDYARKTPYYEQILQSLVLNPYSTKLAYVASHMSLFKLIKLKYKIKKALSSGTKQERYKRKYENVKQLIKDAKQLKKEFFSFYY